MTEHIEKILIPDIGGATDVSVIEVMVSPGQQVKVEDSLITLEGEKATMEIPSPLVGKVEKVALKVGDKVSEGDLILTLKTVEDVASTEKKTSPEKISKENTEKSTTTNKSAEKKQIEVRVPDIGSATDVNVIEVSVKVNDNVKKEDTLITLEGDKASMDVPSPYEGKVTKIHVKPGDKVSSEDLIVTLEMIGASEKESEPSTPATKKAEAAPTPTPIPQKVQKEEEFTGEEKGLHAGPAVRRIAHEVGIDLNKIPGSGPKGRVLKEDVKGYVQQRILAAESGSAVVTTAAPAIDFSKFGATEIHPLSKIQKFSGINLQRNWATIPHVTQFGEADISMLESFRQEQKKEAEERGVKLTLLAFLLKAVVAALKEYPKFNSSLDPSGLNLILKKYFHVGVAVDTPQGLVVPVIRDVDKKSLFEVAKELGVVSQKARNSGLSITDMQGGCFSISSLGGIGGIAFTPIINAPEVAILGVSTTHFRPVYQPSGEFVPRLMLPLSLSYDHRVIDGADGARFMVYLTSRLADIRTLLL